MMTAFRPNTTVKRLLQFFVELCLLRAGPQDLPASWLLFWLLLPLNLLLGLLLIGDTLGGLDKAFLGALVDLLVMLGWLELLLVFKRHPRRFLQSATALLGSGVLLGLVTLPLQLALGDRGGTGELELLTQTLSLLVLFLMLWSMVVTANVLRHALEVGFSLAMGLSLCYAVLTTLLVAVLLPAGGG
jgi:hypothetical protein